MKKYLISILMLGMFLFVLCGCGGSPLEKAYDSLSALSGDTTDTEAFASNLRVQYDAENEVLLIYLDQGADLEKIFEALNKDIDGQEIGTLIFTLDGTRGDDYEKELVKKIGELPCTSLERIGLNYSILDYEKHDWLAIADKTDKLYIDSPITVFSDYSDEEMKSLAKFKDIQIAYEPSLNFGCIDMLEGAENVTFVTKYEVEETAENDPLAQVTDDNPYLETAESDASLMTDSATNESSEGEGTDEETPALMLFEYYGFSAEGIEDFAKCKSLSTLQIYPATGYELSQGGEMFIKSLQYLRSSLKVNAPGKAGTEDMVEVTAIETPTITDEQAASLLAGFLDEEVEGVYKACDKYKKADGDAVLNGKVLVYEATPSSEDWSEKKKYSSNGNVRITEAAKEGIKVPDAIGDYNTFVYIYPTYNRTGVYTSGTKAYSETLHVQVFDLQDNIAYEAKEVGSEPAPQSFSYYAGSVPDKHSGTVDRNKAYKYLKKLKTK